MKKLLMFAFAVVISQFLNTNSHADELLKMTINGVQLEQKPVTYQGKVMMPLRGVVEAVGGELTWNEPTQKITIKKGQTTVELTMNDKVAYIDGKKVVQDIAPKNINDRTLVSSTFIAQVLGQKIEWNKEKKSIEIGENLYPILKDSKIGYVNKEGKIVITPQFDAIKDGNDGITLVQSGDKFGYLDKKTNFILTPQFTYIDDFYEGLAVVGMNGQYGYIDKKGNVVIQPQFDQGTYFINGIASILKEGKWGYIDQTGKIIAQPQFDQTGPFEEGMATVMKDGKWGYIDQTGNIVIKPQFDGVGQFTNGVATVRVNDGYGYINKKGEYIYNPTK